MVKLQQRGFERGLHAVAATGQKRRSAPVGRRRHGLRHAKVRWGARRSGYGVWSRLPTVPSLGKLHLHDQGENKNEHKHHRLYHQGETITKKSTLPHHHLHHQQGGKKKKKFRTREAQNGDP